MTHPTITTIFSKVYFLEHAPFRRAYHSISEMVCGCCLGKEEDKQEEMNKKVLLCCLKGKLETFFIIYFYDFCVPIKAGSHGECE